MIVIRIWEGLGNQMFQYAFAKALSIRGYDVRLDFQQICNSKEFENKREDKREITIDKFNINIPIINQKEMKKYKFLRQSNWKEKIVFFLSQKGFWPVKYYREKTVGYKKELIKFTGDIYLQGTFQSEKYFTDIRKYLLHEFTPKTKICVSRNLIEILETEETVSLHVRRGDYARLNHALNIYYYQRAMLKIEEVISNPYYLIFSDDIAWVKENLDIGARSIIVNEDGRLKDYEELMIMTKCRHNIISNSTFSWWGAWLNQNVEKMVIAPKVWFGDQKKIVLDNWTIV